MTTPLYYEELVRFKNIDIKLSNDLVLTDHAEVSVSLHRKKGLSFSNVVVTLTRGRYRKDFRLGFFYEEKPNIDELPVEIIIEESCVDYKIVFFVIIDKEWRDFHMTTSHDMSPYSEENISHFIKEKPKPVEEEKSEKPETSTYEISIGETKLDIVIDNEILEFFKHDTNRLKEQILGSAIIWACYNAHGRQIRTIMVNVVDQMMQSIGLEYHFTGIDEGLPEFDKFTMRP